MKEYGLDVKFESTGFFNVIFKRRLLEKTVEKSPRKIPEKYQKIIEVIKENPSFSRKEISLKLGESKETIQSRLRKLIKEGLIKRVGPDKGGHWEILR